MKLSEAIKLLEEGKKIKKMIWTERQYLEHSRNSIRDERGSRWVIDEDDFGDIWQEACVTKYNFLEAVNLMRIGKKMKRIGWGSSFTCKHGVIVTNDITKFNAVVDDILATDWVEVSC